MIEEIIKRLEELQQYYRDERHNIYRILDSVTEAQETSRYMKLEDKELEIDELIGKLQEPTGNWFEMTNMTPDELDEQYRTYKLCNSKIL